MPIVRSDLRKVSLLRRAVRIGPRGLVDLPEAPSLLAHRVPGIGNNVVIPSLSPTPSPRAGDARQYTSVRLCIKLVKIITVAGQYISDIGEIRLVCIVWLPAGIKINLLCKATGCAITTTRVRPQLRVLKDAGVVPSGRVEEVPWHATSRVGLAHCVLRRGLVLGHQPQRVRSGGRADVGTPARCGHALL